MAGCRKTAEQCQVAWELAVHSESANVTQREQLVALAARYRVPASYFRREFIETGGLTSYAADIVEAARQTSVYVGRILKGEEPRDLPVMQPTKFDFAINLRTAKTLGLAVLDELLALANEVIE